MPPTARSLQSIKSCSVKSKIRESLGLTVVVFAVLWVREVDRQGFGDDARALKTIWSEGHFFSMKNVH